MNSCILVWRYGRYHIRDYLRPLTGDAAFNAMTMKHARKWLVHENAMCDARRVKYDAEIAAVAAEKQAAYDAGDNEKLLKMEGYRRDVWPTA